MKNQQQFNNTLNHNDSTNANDNNNTHKLKHKLKNRHLQMIALGGAIGTGLFFGASKSIALTGPSIVIAYILGGCLMYIIMRALGEMTVNHPNSGSFSEYAHQYVNGYTGFIAGWNAWFEYAVVCMVDLTAITFFLDYWIPSTPHWLICLVVLIFFTWVNLVSVKFFGEFEFWFAGIKVIAIIAMLIFSAYLIFTQHAINPQINEYMNPKLFFAGGIRGFLFAIIIVVFSFGGTEFVSIAAGEAENPKRNVPRAINGIIIRIILFYVLTMMVIICLYPYNKLSTDISPFVDVFQKIGIPVAAQVMNIVIITAGLSAFNSCLYSSSRMLYNLASHGNAPRKLSHLSKNGVPTKAILATSGAILFAVVINYLFPKHAIMYLLTIATGAIVVTWFIILISHFYYRQQHNKNHTKLEYKLYFFPYSNFIAISALFMVVMIMTQMDDKKLSIFITPLWILILSICFLIRKNKKQ